jgi:hypothetical protein
MLKSAWRNRHLILAIGWVLLAIPTILWWKEAIVWVALMSIYANAEASLAAHNAARSQQKEKPSHEHGCACQAR